MNKGIKAIKTKMTKRDTRAFWRTVIITSILASIPLLLLIARYFEPNKSVRDIPISLNVETSITSSEDSSTITSTMATASPSNPDTYRNEAKTFYPTFQQAIDAIRPNNVIGVRRISDKVLQFENKDAASAYYWCDDGTGGGLGLGSILSAKKNGSYSNILEDKFLFFGTDPSSLFFNIGRYDFTQEETIVACLPAQFINVDEQSLPNNGIPTYLGISDNPRINNLRILGKPPTRIIKSSVRGRTYYIWIYEGLDIRGVLLNTKGFTFGKFTYGQLIDILHIHFASDSDPLSKNVPITTAN